MGSPTAPFRFDLSALKTSNLNLNVSQVLLSQSS